MISLSLDKSKILSFGKDFKMEDKLSLSYREYLPLDLALEQLLSLVQKGQQSSYFQSPPHWLSANQQSEIPPLRNAAI